MPYRWRRKSVGIENEIPHDLRSPPMFPAELTLVFSNLLTNAVKAAQTSDRIRATGEISEDGVIVRVENSGKAINPESGEKWFRPFESTTTETDPILGQGMGMGLPITRNIPAVCERLLAVPAGSSLQAGLTTLGPSHPREDGPSDFRSRLSSMAGGAQ